ncbi:efflux RND transporter periplasmic adaptor subunit [Pseudomonas capsici]|uniref:efflux RND transporter periplasmic adaptor subunit n=1 Tax=Pseudomonas capsici TaxID=2810614 RepID=UPI0021F16DA0|nr:HlyD family efflux transporter periplasmic adaptor subunit [Pseudomonas capsici]MCV4340805.1 HlyD family efflux transporter periplasmic adaptor subunit [Pseudomonas capsici]
MSQAQSRSMEHLTLLVQLEQQVRAADSLQALGFILLNDSRSLLEYRQAILWRCDTQSLQGFSGLAVVEQQAPMVTWLNRQCRRWQQTDNARHIHELTVSSVPTEDQPQWREYCEQRLIWLPLQKAGGPLLGALLLSRDAPLRDTERLLAPLLLDCYGHAWSSLLGHRPRRQPLRQRKRLWWMAGLAAMALLMLPVRQSVLAPAEIVARDPAVLRAPLAAVVDRILVQPNQRVTAGQPLVQLDTREQTNHLESARQAYAVANAELRQAQQQALFDERSKATLATLQGRREQARNDVEFYTANLKRLSIEAPRDGIAIFDDPSDWIGRPVTLGERIMLIAEPQDADLEIQLPVADAIALQPDTPVKLFLNTDPTSPLQATLQRIGYRASVNPDGVMAYRLKSTFDNQDPRIRIGLKGSAKLYAEPTVLFYYLLRRPLAALRIHVGL